MKSMHSPITRGDALRTILGLPATVALVIASTSRASAKGSKAQFSYQESPNGKQRCGGCSLFVPGTSAKTAGSCRVVDGPISPNGWCTAFTPKA